MKHYSFEEWLSYVKNELDEDTREEYEDHLYICDQCLEIYLLAVEDAEDDLPVLTDSLDFTDAIMKQINEKPMGQIVPFPKQQKQKRFYETAIFHYAVAAAMTLLFVTTGVFQSLTDVQGRVFHQEQSSVTEGIVDKTFAWMDALDHDNKEDTE